MARLESEDLGSEIIRNPAERDESETCPADAGSEIRNGKIEREVGRLLAERGLTLAIAESCTGGLIGHRITSVSGSSAYFLGGIIAYSDEVKIRELGVEVKVLERDGAVSESVAKEMAVGVRDRLCADIGIGITGIAGPGGGSAEKPVGLVFVSVAGVDGCRVCRFNFDGDRMAIKKSSSDAALGMLMGFLGDENISHRGPEERTSVGKGDDARIGNVGGVTYEWKHDRRHRKTKRASLP